MPTTRSVIAAPPKTKNPSSTNSSSPRRLNLPTTTTTTTTSSPSKSPQSPSLSAPSGSSPKTQQHHTTTTTTKTTSSSSKNKKHDTTYDDYNKSGTLNSMMTSSTTGGGSSAAQMRAAAAFQTNDDSTTASSYTTGTGNDNDDDDDLAPPPTPPSPESFIPQVKNLIEQNQHRKAIEIADSCIGNPTYADLPMFDIYNNDDTGKETSQLPNNLLLDFLALRVECWLQLHLYGRVLEDVGNAMRIDLASVMNRRDFVVPQLKSIFELGDVQVGMQVTSALEIAVQRNGALLEDVLEWKRKFILQHRKRNELSGAFEANTIIIGSRRIGAEFPECRHGCPDREPASFFQMEVVLHQMQCTDGFVALYRLYTEYEGQKLPWRHWMRQELRKAIDAAAVENWKSCRDATRQFLLSREFSHKETAEAFVDSMDTLGRIPNPLKWDVTHHFFKAYDRTMSSVDQLIELLVELAKSGCSCMNEIADLRAKRGVGKKIEKGGTSPHQQQQQNATSNNKSNGKNEGNEPTMNENNKSLSRSYIGGDGSLSSYCHSPNAQLAAIKKHEAVRDSGKLKEEGNVLFLQKKFNTALKRYEEAIALDPENSELLFNKSSALYELGQFDSAIVACDKTLEHHSASAAATAVVGDYFKLFVAKVLARRGEALEKLGAFDEAILNFQESCDAFENPQVQVKIFDCQRAKQKREIEQKIQSDATAEKNKNENENEEENSDTFLTQEKLLFEKIGSSIPPPSHASCVIVEPCSSLTASTKGQISLTVFPTQVSTASPYFTEAVPMPFLLHAGFPFSIVATSKTVCDSKSGSENYFAALASKTLEADVAQDLPFYDNVFNKTLWSTSGSILVLRKDFRPVSCTQVLNLFRLLLDVWTVGQKLSSGSSSSPAKSMDELFKMKRQERGECFLNPSIARQKIFEFAGNLNGDPDAEEEENNVDNVEPVTKQELEQPENEQEQEQEQENQTNTASAAAAAASSSSPTAKTTTTTTSATTTKKKVDGGEHVLNTFSDKQRYKEHEKSRLLKQAVLLKDQGNVLYKARRFRTALMRYDEGLAIDSTNPILLYNRAAALIELQQSESAVESCNLALDCCQTFKFFKNEGEKVELQQKIIKRMNTGLKKLGRVQEIPLDSQMATSGVGASLREE